MYLDHFGLHEPPFRITPHTDFFFSGANRGATLDALIYAIVHDEGIVKISGEVGSGKTMLCRMLMERLPNHVTIVYLANPSLSRDDILYAIADDLQLGLPENARSSSVLRALQEHLIHLYAAGKRVVVLIDEAHAMPTDTLEEIRLLSNLESNRNKLLQLVLFGQPELNDTLARADMRQLKERITHNFSLPPLVRDDVAEYLEFRMRAAGYKGPNVFSPAATRLIADASKGLTRRINILADKSLLAAFSDDTHQITAKQVRTAVRDCDFSTATGRAPRPPATLWVAAGGLALLLLLVGWLLIPNPAPHPPATPVAPPPTQTIPLAPPPATASPAATAPTALIPDIPTPPLTTHHLDMGTHWLANAQDSHWFLQLLTLDEAQSSKLEGYLEKLQTSGVPMKEVRAYRSDLSGKMRYGIIYGDYASQTEALAAAHTLPLMIRSKKPQVRQVSRLR